MNHEKHHGHFEAPREKKRLTGRQKGALGIVLALAVLIGLGVGIYKTVVRPPQKTEPVVETQPEAEETKEPEIKLPTIKHVVTKVDEDTGKYISCPEYITSAPHNLSFGNCQTGRTVVESILKYYYG